MNSAAFFCSTLLAAFGCAAAARAQDRPGEVLVGGMTTTTAPSVPGGLWVVDLAQNTITPLQNVPPPLLMTASLCADPYVRGRFYAGTYNVTATSGSICDIVEFTASKGIVTGWRFVNAQPLLEDYVIALSVVGEDLVYLGRQSLSRVGKASGQRTELAPIGASLVPTAMACDGRFAYVVTNVRNVHRVDLQGMQPPFLLHRAQVGLVDLINAIAIDGDGNLLLGVVDNPFGVSTTSLRTVDVEDGALLGYVPLPFTGPRSIGFHRNTGDILVAGGMSGAVSSVAIVHDGVVAGAPFGALPNALPGLAINQTLPLHHFGTVCPSSAGEIRIRGRTSPQRGNVHYGIEVFSPLRLALHVLFVGGHIGPGQALDLGPYGAPSCELGLQPYDSVIVLMAGDGTGFLPMPIPSVPELEGAVFDVQVGALDPFANALGVAGSQPGSIVIE